MFLSLENPPTLLLCSVRQFAPGEQYINRIFSKSVFIFMRSGVLRLTENHQPVELRTGDYYILRARLLHEGNLPCETPLYYFMHLHANFDSESGLPIRGTYPSSILADLERIAQEQIYETTPYYKYQLFYSVLNKLHIHNHETAFSTETALKTYLDEHYTKDIQLKELENIFSYSANHLAAIFKKKYHLTIHQYIIHLRIQQAKQLLLENNMKLSVIAEECGYKDSSTFYRNFLAETGTTPTAWKSSILFEMS